MRVFAISDIHIDYEANANWIANLSSADYRDDLLILAGDVSDALPLLDWCLGLLAQRFKKVLFVPGNHDLWVRREKSAKTSLDKLEEVAKAVESSGASMKPFREGHLRVIPLLGWYDYSFGEPSDELRSMWMDYRACRWPDGLGERQIGAHFAALNGEHIDSLAGERTITFSHFLPRIDLMPNYVPASKRFLYPVLGGIQLERQLRMLQPEIHVYGHSHIKRNVTIDGISYINNAFGYPDETWNGARDLLCIHEC